ncbi:hypothetical protein GE21DRAFT_1072070 [Neurospora crassa]|nr:hypothetical protein GE21DRAFT_1072070 [Neurospora crassa]
MVIIQEVANIGIYPCKKKKRVSIKRRLLRSLKKGISKNQNQITREKSKAATKNRVVFPSIFIFPTPLLAFDAAAAAAAAAVAP